jgi:hypothetical protein
LASKREEVRLMHGQAINYEIEKQVAAHLASTTWEALPPPAREQAVRAVLWYLATGLEGASEPGQAPLIRYVAMQDAKEEATILGSRQRTTAEPPRVYRRVIVSTVRRLGPVF